MTKGITLTKAVKAYAAEKRRGGHPPTLEQLAAWQAGHLSEKEREEISEYISLHPETARFLLQFSPQGPDIFEELGEEEMEADWRKLERELDLGKSGSGGADRKADTASSDPSQAGGRPLGRVKMAYATAAVFFFLALAAFAWSFYYAPIREGFGLIDVSADAGNLRGVAENQKYRYFPAYSLFFQNDDWSDGQKIAYTVVRQGGDVLLAGTTEAFVNAQDLPGISVWLEGVQPGVYTIQVPGEPGQSFEILPPE